jgi:hypothetical protein
VGVEEVQRRVTWNWAYVSSDWWWVTSPDAFDMSKLMATYGLFRILHRLDCSAMPTFQVKLINLLDVYHGDNTGRWSRHDGVRTNYHEVIAVVVGSYHCMR